MGAAANLTALANYFRKAFTMPERKALATKRRPTLRMMNQESKKLGSGDAFYVTMNAFNGFSAAHGFEAAMNDYTPNTSYRWLISGPKTMHGRITVDALMAAQASAGALIDLKKNEVDGVMDNFLSRIEQKLWGDTTAIIGRAASVSGTTTMVVTLETASDVYNFEPGMFVLGTNSAGTTTRTNGYRVDYLDYEAGTITLTLTTDNSSALVANDYLVVRGDGTLSIPGIPSFIPATVQTSTLLGVDRSTASVQVVQGFRQTYAGTIELTIKKLVAKMGRFVNRENPRMNICLSFGDWLKLDEELGGRITRDPDANQKFGTEGIVVRTPFGAITVIAIPALRDGRGYLIDWSTWTLHTLKDVPHVNDDDGNTWLRLAPGTFSTTTMAAATANSLNGDGVEMRLRAWFHPVCHAPISNGTFATA